MDLSFLGDGKEKILKKIKNGFLLSNRLYVMFVLFTVLHPYNFMKTKVKETRIIKGLVIIWERMGSMLC